MEQYAFQHHAKDWAHLSRLNGDLDGAAEFEAYDGNGDLKDRGLLQAALKLTESRILLLHNSIRDLAAFQNHVLAIMKRTNTVEFRI